jgi:putative CocE/NonD family hydrolase
MLREELLRGQGYLRKRQLEDETKRPDKDLRLEAIANLLDGTWPLLVTADRATDIASALPGLAVVAMDCRGTGASFGTWGGPWLEGEAQDGAEVLAWAARQAWSSGRFALFGQSYEAGTALALAALPAAQPHVACVVAVNPFIHFFSDIAAPGGVRRAPFPPPPAPDAPRRSRSTSLPSTGRA